MNGTTITPAPLDDAQVKEEQAPLPCRSLRPGNGAAASFSIRTGRGSAAAGAITRLLQRFGEHWQIAYQPDLRVWSAKYRAAGSRRARFICAPDPAGLAGRLADAERDEP
jgi:hypothetical protein